MAAVSPATRLSSNYPSHSWANYRQFISVRLYMLLNTSKVSVSVSCGPLVIVSRLGCLSERPAESYVSYMHTCITYSLWNFG